MFRKLVSNLPFNPSLIAQVGFYADRLRQEKSIRRLSFIFMSLALAVQSLAIISPPERSLALSSNHIISGLKTKQDVINAWNNDPSVSKIYGKFGVTLDDIKNMSGTPFATVSTRPGTDYWSIGRNSLTSFTNVADVYKNQQIALEYEEGSYVYMRPLKAWDIRNPYNTYAAFKGTIAATGETFWIIQNCGNLTKIGKYTPPAPPTPEPTPTPEPPKPKLQIKKSIVSRPDILKPGDSFTYAIEYRNSSKDSLAENVTIEDQLDTKRFTIVSPKNLNITANGYLNHQVGNLSYTPHYNVLKLTVRLKDPLATPDKVCNQALAKASNASNVTSKEVCISYINPCPFDTDVADANNPECVEPKLVCSLVDTVLNRTTRKATFKTTASSTNDKLVKITGYNYSFGDDTEVQVASNKFTNSIMHTYQPGEYTARVTVSFRAPTEDGETAQTADCSHSIEFEEDEPLGQSKTVANVTKGLEGDGALDQKVGAGDVLEYKLTTLNSQSYDRTDITIEDYVGDILDYATLDVAALEASGGIFNEETQKVLWDDVTVSANSQVESVFRVTLLDPIPATNQPSSVTTNFDCRISNAYGNEITLEVQCPVVKGLETLPNTGPGTSLLAVGLMTGTIGYFFARSRLLAKEINLVRTDYATTGGM